VNTLSGDVTGASNNNTINNTSQAGNDIITAINLATATNNIDNTNINVTAGAGSFTTLTSSGNTTLGTGSNAVNTFGSGGGGSSSNTFGNNSNNNQFGNQAASNNFGNTATSNNQFGNNTPSNEFGDNVSTSGSYANDFGSTSGTATGTVTNTIGAAVTGSTVNTTIGGGAGSNSVAIQSGTTWSISGGGGVQFHAFKYTGGGTYAAQATDYYINVTSGTGVTAPSGVSAGQKLVITNATGANFTTGTFFIPDAPLPATNTWNLIYDGSEWQIMN
jgi:hypothetical protein